MGTITITAAGFGSLPASAPAGWPVGVTWPGTGSNAPNGNRQATISDAQMVQLMTWVAAEQMSRGTVANPTTPTIAQILAAWIGTWFNGTKAAVQRYFTPAVVVPPPIDLN